MLYLDSGSVPVTAAFVTALGSGTTFWVIVGLVALFGWLASLRLHPFTACSSCKGAPKYSGAIATRSFRFCGTCKGSGRRLRIGARLWSANR